MIAWLAAAFAVVNGANDGGAMVASQLRVPRVRPVVVIVTLAAALGILPLLFGTGVADTLTSGLVRTSDDATPTLIGIGVIVAMVVVGLLTRAGLPTSLTLGLVGGIVGAGTGLGMPVIAAGLVRVVLIGLAAPVVGGVLAQLLTGVSAAVLAHGGKRGLAGLGFIALVMQAVAYATNDGQKMLAVVAVTSLGITPATAAGVAVLFAVGAVAGMRAAAGTLGGVVMRAGPPEEITAQLGGATAVLSSAALGVPVSMTQAITGGLVGTGLLRGVRQVRWRVAGQLVAAWIVTLPSAGIAGASIGWIVGGLT